MSDVTVTPVTSKADRAEFIDFAYRINAGDPNWVPPLRMDVKELLNPAKNPFFEHGEIQLFLARRQGRTVGRISAHMDTLAWTLPPEQGMGPGTGNWGLFEAEDEAVSAALIETAEGWLREQGMTKVLAPISISIWDEPGLLVKGHDHPPVILMGHNSPRYQPWIEGRGYDLAKKLMTFELDVVDGFPPLIQRIVASGEKNPRITIRKADRSRFVEESETLFRILNDAWSQNWGFVPITEREVAYVSRKLKALVQEDLLRFAQIDGEDVAFMLTFPDMNRIIKPWGGKLLPFNWIKLLWWVRKPVSPRMRVPLMGVVKRLQSSRMASQLAFMMIEFIRRDSVRDYATTSAEIGWILDDNQGMLSVAEAIGATVNREYNIYGKAL